jgi:hypothetical protein
MSSDVKVAWSVPLSEDFDLREFALGVLSIAKENLARDYELIPTAFAITENEIQCYSVSFEDHFVKSDAYRKLVELAKTQNAVALITCNDAFWSDSAGPDFVEGYYPGRLAAENAKECIMLTVSGPGIKTWSAEIPYKRIGVTLEFGDVREESGGELDLLEGWVSTDQVQ